MTTTVAAPPGPSSAELQAALFRLDLRLRMAVETFRVDLAERAKDPFRGLYISDADIDELLASTPAAELAQRLLDEDIGPVPARLRRLSELFDLDNFEREVLLVCLAPDVDLRYERLYAYLQDDVSRRRPTVDLVLRLLGTPGRESSAEQRNALGPAGRLMRRGLLIRPSDEPVQASLLARPLRIEERIVDYLVGSDRIDVRLEPFAQLHPADDEASHWSLPDDLRTGLVRLLSNDDIRSPGVGSLSRSSPDDLSPIHDDPSSVSHQSANGRDLQPGDPDSLRPGRFGGLPQPSGGDLSPITQNPAASHQSHNGRDLQPGEPDSLRPGRFGGLPQPSERPISSTHAGRLLYLCGPASAAKRGTARAAAAQAGQPLLLVDAQAILVSHAERAGALLAAAVREALLQRAVLTLDGFDALLAEEPLANLALGILRRALADSRGTVLLLGDLRWEPSAWLPVRAGLRLDLSPLAAGDRVRLWRSQVDGQLPADAVTELASRYRLVEDEAIHAVTAEARSRAELRGASEIELVDVQVAARTIATPPLEGLAHHIEPRYGWDDIVLPADGLAQLREMCARARHQMTVLEQWGYGRKHARRRGTTALFAGPPGTGKTMAAEIVSGSLGLDLYRIDLSAVVSKYIGETEKNLERIFRAADQGDAVLLFDEADAIFGKRSEVRDARDRYANVEVAYLLQRLEVYEGLAVLTTNLRGNIDEAFVRRLDCVLEFPLPEEAERLQIWERAVPREAPMGDDVDLAFLARKFKLAGGHIRNIALTAAFLAAEDRSRIGMKHFARATRREYQKLGKLIAESDFEQHYSLLKDEG
ncbi:MAG: ATP-binding protein [Chloroflexi bacterium]|nr:ATP-binding protein [Chloroflexota bacterium]